MMFLFFALALTCQLSCGLVAMEPEGPFSAECSRFSFQENVLKKLVDMEYKLQKLEKSVVKLASKTKDSLKAMKSEQDDVITPKVMFSSDSVSKSRLYDEVMVFENTVYNFGGGYDKVSGIFKAPVSGTYLFTAHLCADDDYRVDLRYDFMVKQSDYLSGRLFNKDGVKTCNGLSALVDLNTSERVWIKADGGVFTSNYKPTSRFSGILLRL